jgi:hypothetical protein
MESFYKIFSQCKNGLKEIVFLYTSDFDAKRNYHVNLILKSIFDHEFHDVTYPHVHKSHHCHINVKEKIKATHSFLFLLCKELL